MQALSNDRLSWPKEAVMEKTARMAAIETPALTGASRDAQFMGMLHSFRSGGGLARGHELADLLAIGSGQNLGALARWIVDSAVIHFDWQHDTWLPVFQFGAARMAPSADVTRVVKELSGVFDPWDTAQWFARPSVCLGGRTPADAMESDPDLVLRAARCDRYVVDA